jgi:hypothetical protein
MQRFVFAILIVLWPGIVAGQNGSISLKRTRVIVEGRVSVLQLSSRFTTTIRLPEPVSSVVVGEPNLFQTEHSANEPLLVFVKPTTAAVAETNLVITTISGRQFLVVLSNSGESEPSDYAVDLLVVSRISGTSFVEEAYFTSLVAESLRLGSETQVEKSKSTSIEQDSFVRLLENQRGRALPRLEGDRLGVGIGQVMQRGSHFVVGFSVLNSTHHAVELLSPQIQLAGHVRSGLFKQSSRWTSIEQVPVIEFHLDKRKLDPGVRTDGFVVFERPALKQSNENVLLQVADAAMVDRPVLVPINFSVENYPEGRYER